MQSTLFMRWRQVSCVMLLRDIGAAAEILGRRNLQQREPVDRRVIMRRRRLVRRRHRGQIDLLAGLGAQFWRIHQPVTADPDLVVHLRRQVGDHVAALVVGDDDLGEFRRQLRGFRDHPDAGLGPVRTAHHPADVVIVDGNRRLLRMRRRRNQGRQARRRGNTKSSQREIVPDLPENHGRPPCDASLPPAV